jgi:Domain of unknown function (DUF1707)/Cell wall-active antibiotics response 4TMS YvqF
MVSPGRGILASDAERDRSIELLRDAAAEGRLTFEELADRIATASAARTRDDLELLTRDLPAAQRALAGGDVVPPTSEARIVADARRSGPWKVPRESRWRSVLGDIVLDLREAQVTSSEVTIDARTIFGDIELLVPEGIAVEVRCRSLLGSQTQKAGRVAPPGSPRVILEGRTVIGDVRVRARRLRERLTDALRG